MTSTLDDVAAALRRYADMAESVVADHLPGPAALDYLAGPVSDYPSRRGKGIRPALCIAACEAFGGLPSDVLPSAAALEMLHNAFLIHDDIEDGSELRRGEPTLHRRFGMELAINAGDALALTGVGVLRENVDLLGPILADRIFREFDFMTRQTVDGQAIDIGWRVRNHLDLGPADYLDLIMKKTCWYTTILPLRVGALVGSGGRADLRPMIDFGFYLGAAFQIQDDILNLTGDPERHGKEPLGDVLEAKRTLMLVHLLAAAGPDHRLWLEAYLSRTRSDRTVADAERVLQLLHGYGSIGFARAFAAGIARSCEDAFSRAFADVPDSPARRFIAELIPFMIEREH